jgi:hypothetical protein
VEWGPENGQSGFEPIGSLRKKFVEWFPDAPYSQFLGRAR